MQGKDSMRLRNSILLTNTQRVSFPFNVPISEQFMTDIVALKSAKLLVWDKALGLGTTDPLAEFAAVTSIPVESLYFAKRGYENVARIIKR
jgi:hypothetical protein